MVRQYNGYIFQLRGSYDPIVETFGTTMDICVMNVEHIIPKNSWETEEDYKSKILGMGKIGEFKLTVETIK